MAVWENYVPEPHAVSFQQALVDQLLELLGAALVGEDINLAIQRGRGMADVLHDGESLVFVFFWKNVFDRGVKIVGWMLLELVEAAGDIELLKPMHGVHKVQRPVCRVFLQYHGQPSTLNSGGKERLWGGWQDTFS